MELRPFKKNVTKPAPKRKIHGENLSMVIVADHTSTT
jgi:hypothetical protein